MTNEEKARYAALYLGQMSTVITEQVISYHETEPIEMDCLINGSTIRGIESDEIKDFQLHLRHLDSMTDEEAKECAKLHRECHRPLPQGIWSMLQGNAAQTLYLLSRGFDLFGLKEKGLAKYSEI